MVALAGPLTHIPQGALWLLTAAVTGWATSLADDGTRTSAAHRINAFVSGLCAVGLVVRVDGKAGGSRENASEGMKHWGRKKHIYLGEMNIPKEKRNGPGLGGHRAEGGIGQS